MYRIVSLTLNFWVTVIRSFTLSIGLALSGSALYAAPPFDLNDCIIAGMRGVSSDAAARQIRYACDQKAKMDKQLREEEQVKVFGEDVEVELAELAKHYEVESAGLNSIVVKNKSAEQTLTYLRLSVTPVKVGAPELCDFDKTRTYAYKVVIKPGASLKLIYPLNGNGVSCTRIGKAVARLATWKDTSFSFSTKPVDKDPYEGTY